VKLRGSDLALAQITSRWPGSLRLFEKFQDECESNGFTLDLGLLVRTLVVFATRQSGFNTVGNIPLSQLKEAWTEAKTGITYAVNFLRVNAAPSLALAGRMPNHGRCGAMDVSARGWGKMCKTP
jgi:hypothetical protein